MRQCFQSTISEQLVVKSRHSKLKINFTYCLPQSRLHESKIFTLVTASQSCPRSRMELVRLQFSAADRQ